MVKENESKTNNNLSTVFFAGVVAILIKSIGVC